MFAYIHIPFCKSKCRYCSFVSLVDLKSKELYLDALEKDIKHNYGKDYLQTVYFGGGTPSILKTSDFKRLLNLLNFDFRTEITVEINPDDVSEQYLFNLKEVGVNRLSIGCQTFDDNILKIIGRRHNSQSVIDAVQNARNVGFDNISIDLIYGLPTQKLEDFDKDLNKCKKLGINHISLYGLKIDDGCWFYKNKPNDLPSDEIQADMYKLAIETLNSYEHYEISNFGRQSLHNMNYWNNGNYYGFGLAAHGYLDDVRYSNYCDMKNYIANPITPQNKIILTKEQQLEEEIFLGLRKIKGINYLKINEKYGIDFEKKYSKILEKYNQFLIKQDENYCLTIDGILVSNTIMSEFIEV